MAITRAQQAKQMLQNGGMLVKPGFGGTRQGYRGPGGYRGGPGGSAGKGKEDKASSDKGDTREQYSVASTMGTSPRSVSDLRVERDTGLERARQRNIDLLSDFKKKRPDVNFPKFTPTGFLADTFLRKPFQKFSDFLASKNRPFFEEVIRAGKIPGLNFSTVANMTEEELEQKYKDYMSARMNNEIDAYGNPINRGDRGDPDILLPQGIMTQAPSDMEEEPEYVNPLSLLTPRIAGTQFAADGGRIGFQGGGKDLGAGASGMGSGGKDRTRDKDGDPRDRRKVEQYKKPPSQTKPDSSVFDKTKALATVPLNFIGSLFGNPFDPKKPIQVINTKAQKDYLNYLANQKEDDTGVLSYDDYGTKFNLSDLKDPIAFSTAMTMGGTGFKKADTGDITYTGGTYDFDGAVPFIDSGGLMGLAYRGGEFLGDKLKPAKLAEGGMASLEDMDREAFLLGGIAKGLKKATRAVKKIAKSPIGKAALGIAAFKFGPTIFGKGSFNPFLRTVAGDTAFSPLGSIFSKAGLVSKSGLPTFMGGITFASILPLLAGKTDDEKKDILNDYFASQELTPSTTKRQAGSEFDFYNYNLAEGGTPRKEPVAKKVMPLLDMGGMEKDYRAEGGFVPIGRMEKADDVPARLSKNEFVFTADAVRNAGDGDVDKGAEVMYNMMKNLEAGGEVSEESQGLDGARKMFQTSQRLGEVI